MSDSRSVSLVRRLLLFTIFFSSLLALLLLGPAEDASAQVSCLTCVRQCKAAGGTSMECVAQCAALGCQQP
jgi:hypothetical protein